ncbi:aldo/keto reductase [Nonomuraea sp. NPDC001636]|uniref:aldo/keto reductase n=1 Tax=Nonomuraea sp. NPDC001636 TaxID=3154391 RepID=UPI003325F8B5
MNFWTEKSEPDSHVIMDRGHEHGIDFFDTADVHADGRTEQIIGRWFAQGDGRTARRLAARAAITLDAPALARLDEFVPAARPQTSTKSVRLVTSPSFSV